MMKSAFLAWPCFLAPLATGQEPTVSRSYDLSEVVPELDRTAWIQPLAVPPALETDIVRERGPDASAEPPEILVEILSHLLGDELRQQGRTIEFDGVGRLVVVAPAAIHERIQRALDGMRAAFQAEVEIQVDVLTLAAGDLPQSPTNVLAADAAGRLQAELVGRGAELESHTLRLRVGRTSSVRIQRQHPFVFDHDVEVAQASWMYDPVLRTAEEGTRIVMRGVSLPGGVLLTSVVRLARLVDEIRTEELVVGGTIASEREGVASIAGPDKVQTARVGLQAVAFQSFLPDGKVLLVQLQSASGAGSVQHFVLLRKRSGEVPGVVSLPFGNDGRMLVLFNGERVRPPSLTLLSDVAGYDFTEHPVLAASSSSELPLSLRDWVRAHFAVWRAIGPWALAVSDPTWDADSGAAQELLDDASTPRVRDLSVVVHTADGRTLAGFALPLLEGTSAAVMAGTTATELVDYDVEVAQLAAVVDPVYAALFDGLSLVAGMARGSGSGALVSLRGSARMRAEGVLTLSPGGALGPLQLPERRSLVLDERLQLGDEQGQPARVTLGSGSALSVEVQVR